MGDRVDHITHLEAAGMLVLPHCTLCRTLGITLTGFSDLLHLLDFLL